MTRESFHFNAFYFGLCLLVVSLPTSRFMLTVSLMLLAANWLAEANFRERLKLLTSNKPALAFSLIFGLNVLGVSWSDDPMYALTTGLMHKLPTLILPLVIFTSPMLKVMQIRLLLFLFIASVLSTSLIGYTLRSIYNPIDYREASPFIPPTNFSMMLVLAAIQLPLLVKQLNIHKGYLYSSIGLSVWLLFFIFFLRSFTGIASLVGAIIYILFLVLYKHRNTLLKVTTLVISFLFLGFGVLLFTYMYKLTHHEVEVDFIELPSHTSNGNPYSHNPNMPLRENGHLVYIYISDSELKQAWSSRSKLDYNGKDLNDEPLKHTLYRYLSSKGLTKDRDGLMLLADRDVRAIEEGYTNYLYLEWPGIFSRVHELMMGLYMYNNSPIKNPSWSTLTQRIDLWKASRVAFLERPYLGWGTGSVSRAVEYGLVTNKSLLTGSRFRSHNQCFSILLLWGIIGFTAFVALYTYFVIKSESHKIFMFNIFIVVFFFNGLANDPIEGQVGQIVFLFFSIFYSLYYPKLRLNREFIY